MTLAGREIEGSIRHLEAIQVHGLDHAVRPPSARCDARRNRAGWRHNRERAVTLHTAEGVHVRRPVSSAVLEGDIHRAWIEVDGAPALEHESSVDRHRGFRRDLQSRDVILDGDPAAGAEPLAGIALVAHLEDVFAGDDIRNAKTPIG